jgi:hypothetical protein
MAGAAAILTAAPVAAATGIDALSSAPLDAACRDG